MWNRGSRSGWKAFSWISIWTESQQLRTQQVLLQNPWSPGLYGCKWHMEGVSQIGGTCWLSEALKTSVPLDSTSLSLLFWDTLQFCKCVYVVFLLFFIFFFKWMVSAKETQNQSLWKRCERSITWWQAVAYCDWCFCRFCHWGIRLLLVLSFQKSMTKNFRKICNNVQDPAL